MTLEKIIQNFILKESNGPFLLALSGGPDSMVLFYLFCMQKISFQVVHINHNWRHESANEENILRQLCENHKIPFHSKQLFPDQMNGNLEDICRRERLLFFKEIVKKQNLLGVVTGHHGDDQAETVLKRIFEGASLYRLKGLSVRSLFEDLILFRPLLSVRKKDLLQWLDQKGHFYFHDMTNDDPVYLRTRIRKQLLPQLSSHFGKEIVSSLVRIAQASEELEEFLNLYLIPYRKKMCKEEEKYSIDLSEEEISNFKIKLIIKDFFSYAGLTLSQKTLEMLIYLLQKGKGKKEIIVQDRLVTILKKNIIIHSKRCSSESYAPVASSSEFGLEYNHKTC